MFLNLALGDLAHVIYHLGTCVHEYQASWTLRRPAPVRLLAQIGNSSEGARATSSGSDTASKTFRENSDSFTIFYNDPAQRVTP